MPRRTLPLAVTVAIALLTLAAAAGPAQALSKPEKAQNTAIKRATTSAKTAVTNAAKARLAAKRADGKATAAGADAKRANDGASALNALLLPALQALTDLKAGLQSLTTGLQSVKDGLARLTTQGAATEYGVVQISAGSSGPLGTFGAPVTGCFYETADIPDNQQDAIVTGTCNVPNAVAAGEALHILAGIRSDESDGVAGGPAAGVAGIVAYSQSGVNTSTGALTPLGGGATVAVASGPPAVTIPLKSAPTSAAETGFPFGVISTDKLVDLASTQFVGTPMPALLGNPGTTPNRVVAFTVRFNDLTTDAADPAS